MTIIDEIYSKIQELENQTQDQAHQVIDLDIGHQKSEDSGTVPVVDEENRAHLEFLQNQYLQNVQ